MQAIPLDSVKQLPLFDPIEIQLTKGYVAIVDPLDADLADFKWCVLEKFHTCYATRSVGPRHKQQCLLLHRVILSRILERPLERREEVDHINLDGLNNMRSNLRLATHSQNMRNRKVHRDSKSGLKGVYQGPDGRWYSKITVNGRRVSLGGFGTAEESYAAYCKAAIELHGTFAHFD